MTLVGATAIEDKLQDGVPEAIANLAKVRHMKCAILDYEHTYLGGLHKECFVLH